MKIAALTAGLLMMCVPALAHHGTGTYESTKSVTLNGVVTEFAFINPHAALYLDVKDASGKVVKWAVEMNSPGVLRAAGWTKTTFKAGDQINASFTEESIAAAAKAGSSARK